jgi:hypothetical protein
MLCMWESKSYKKKENQTSLSHNQMSLTRRLTDNSHSTVLIKKLKITQLVNKFARILHNISDNGRLQWEKFWYYNYNLLWCVAMQSGRQLHSLAYTTYKLNLSCLRYATKYSQAINHVNMELVQCFQDFSMSIIRCWHQPLMMESETVSKTLNTNSTATQMITKEDFIGSPD